MEELWSRIDYHRSLSMPPGPTRIVGWRERVDLPTIGVSALRCKIDTGAKSSALHAEKLRRFRRGGRAWVRFELSAEGQGPHEVELRVVEMRWVRSSNGGKEHRPLVNIELALGGVQWNAQVTLTTRDGMEFPLLLGRESLRGRFLVDPERSFVQKAAKKKAVKKKAVKKKPAKKKAVKKKPVKKKAR